MGLNTSLPSLTGTRMMTDLQEDEDGSETGAGVSMHQVSPSISTSLVLFLGTSIREKSSVSLITVFLTVSLQISSTSPLYTVQS